MSSNLFRPQCLEARFGSAYGDTPLAPPLSHWAMSGLAATVAFATLCFLLFGSYTPRDSVRGYVLPPAGSAVIYAQSDGEITSLLVHDGDTVARGQALLTISTARANRQDPATAATIVQLLRDELSALEQQAGSEAAAHSLRLSRYRDELAELRTREPLLQEQLRLSEAAVGLASAEIARLSNAGVAAYVSDAARDRAMAVMLASEQQRNGSKLLLQELHERVSTGTNTLKLAAVARDGQMADVQARRARLHQQIAGAAANLEQTVLATTAGRVTAMTVKQGQTISTRAPLLHIVSDMPANELELLVPGLAVGFIRPGAALRVRSDAFPFQIYGVLRGRITQVARSKSLPGERALPVEVATAFYVARARLDETSFRSGNGEHALQVGMTVTADILRDERRLIAWLFDPLLKSSRTY